MALVLTVWRFQSDVVRCSGTGQQLYTAQVRRRERVARCQRYDSLLKPISALLQHGD